MATPTLGMRGSGSWSAAERPQNYRQGILYLYPNGKAPLTAVLSKHKERKTDDPHFHWFTKSLQQKGVALQGSGVFTTSGGTGGTAYTSNTAAAGDVLHAAITADFSKMIREGHEVILRDIDDHSNDVVGKVVAVIRGTDSTSSVAVKLLQADGNGSTGLADADRLIICGSVNPEGGSRPEAISYNVTEFTNYTQIFRTSLAQTRTARKTRLRTKDQYMEAKRECLEDHSIEMEHAFIWGYQSLGTGDNGQPERTTHGIVNFLRDNAPTNVIDFKLDTRYPGEEWDDAGQDWLDSVIEQSFRYASNSGSSEEKFCLCGNAAFLAIQRIVRGNTQYNISRGEARYGIGVTTLESDFGLWHFKRHPLFTHEASTNASVLVLDVPYLEYVYVDDTFFKADDRERKGGGSGIDGIEEEYLTEAGLELHFPETHMYLSNLGVDNTLTP